MGISFIGNPYEQQGNEIEDSDWDTNWEIEDTVPNQDNFVVENIFPYFSVATEEESELDEDFDPEEYDSFEDEVSVQSELDYVHDTDHSYYSDEEELDYVTYPLNDELPADNDKPTTESPENPTTENADAD